MRVLPFASLIMLCACLDNAGFEQEQAEPDPRSAGAEQRSDGGMLEAARSVGEAGTGTPDDFLPPRNERPTTGLCAGPGPARSVPINAAGLTLPVPADYVAVRVVSRAGSPADANDEWLRKDFEKLSETGDACATATSGSCAEKVARHPQATYPSFCAQVCVEFSVVTTRGDEVKRWSKPDEVLALLGPIDSVDDALMVVMSKGYSVNCPPMVGPAFPLEASADAKPVEGGFEVIANHWIGTCPVQLRRYTLFVTSDGEIVERDSVDLHWQVCA